MPNERRGLMGYIPTGEQVRRGMDMRERGGLMRRFGDLGNWRQALDVATELVPGLRGMDLYDSQTGQTMYGRWMQRGHNWLNRNRSMYPSELEDWQRAPDPNSPEGTPGRQAGGPGGAQRPIQGSLPPIQRPPQGGLRSRVGPGRGQTIAEGAAAQRMLEGMRGPVQNMRDSAAGARQAMLRMFAGEEQ